MCAGRQRHESACQCGGLRPLPPAVVSVAFTAGSRSAPKPHTHRDNGHAAVAQLESAIASGDLAQAPPRTSGRGPVHVTPQRKPAPWAAHVSGKHRRLMTCTEHQALDADMEYDHALLCAVQLRAVQLHAVAAVQTRQPDQAQGNASTCDGISYTSYKLDSGQPPLGGCCPGSTIVTVTLHCSSSCMHVEHVGKP